MPYPVANREVISPVVDLVALAVRPASSVNCATPSSVRDAMPDLMS